MKSLIKLIILILFLSNFTTYAIAPPEFILNITQNTLQFMGIIFAFIFSIFFYIKIYLKRIFFNWKKYFNILFLSFIIAFTCSLIFYSIQKQKEKTWKKNINSEIKDVIDDINQKNIILKKYNIISSADDEQKSGIKTLNKKLAITPNEYLEINKNKKVLIIDLRETISYERGSIPGSYHLRFADLINGEWRKLPKNYDYLIFLCWIGTSGNLATEFLSSVGINNVLCFENGVQDIHKNPLIGYKGEYPIQVPKKFENFLTLAESSKFISEGYIVLDIRPYEKFISNTLPNSIWFFYEAMTTEEIEKTFATLNKEKKYFALCDSELSCWLAKVIGLELEKRKFYYAGRYTSNKKIKERKEKHQLKNDKSK